MNLLDNGFYQLYKNFGFTGTAYDIAEKDDEILITIGVAGLKQSDVDVRIKSGRRLILKSVKESKFTAPFHLVFSIPCEIENEETYAQVKDGILTVHLKKKESGEYKVTLK